MIVAILNIKYTHFIKLFS